jgi:tellurite resistance protein
VKKEMMAMEFFPEVNVTQEQAEVIARGMMVVARAEGGAHERELGMIKGFLSDVSGGDARQLAAVEAGPDIAPEAVVAALSQKELSSLFLKSCLLIAYADGRYAAEERTVIEKYAKALSVDAKELGTLEHSVKEFLLGHLAKLSNVEAAARVAKKLDV